MQWHSRMIVGTALSILILVFSGDSSSIFEDGMLWLGDIEGVDLVEASPGRFEIRGDPLRESDDEKIREFVRRYPNVVNKTTRKPISSSQSNRQIFIELSLVEVKRSAFQRLGLRFGQSIGFDLGFQISERLGLKGGTTDPLRLFLDAALQQGEATIHAKQSLVANENEHAVFQVGGQFPIKVVSGYISKVDFKDFGLILKFKGRFISKNKLFLQLNSEISEIDMGSLVDGIPVISKKDLKTQITVTTNEMMALGGLIKSSQSKFSDGLPGLSEIPGLGRLFRSEDFKRHLSEAFIFILAKDFSDHQFSR